tara:strand:- start:266 stop:760 length:495 start_codon:yes stop_codon:yes gene_type:complete
MKNIILLLAILISANIYSQSDISLYVPLNTKHWDGGENYTKGEGGNIGLIATKTYNEQIFTLGVLRNSFGKTAFVAGYGITRNYGKINVSFSAGLSSGYKRFTVEKINEAGEEYTVNVKPAAILKDAGIMIYVIAAIKIPVYKNIGIQFNISPIYINSGLYINL